MNNVIRTENTRKCDARCERNASPFKIASVVEVVVVAVTTDPHFNGTSIIRF